jgi:hypothetical protein
VLLIRPSEWRARRELGNIALILGDYGSALALRDEALRQNK